MRNADGRFPAACHVLRLLPPVVLALAATCSSDDPCRPSEDAWFAIDGSEFLPRSHRVPAHYDDTQTHVCWPGLGPGGRHTAVQPLPNDGLAVLGTNGEDLTVAVSVSGEWLTDLVHLVGDYPPWIEDAALATNGRGDVMSAWIRSDGEQTLSRFTGREWERVDARTFGASPTDASLVLDSVGRPLVAWAEEVAGESWPHVARLVGLDWVELGGSASGTGVATEFTGGGYPPSIGISGADTMAAIWGRMETGIFVSYFDGVRWDGLGPSLTDGGLGSTTSALYSIALSSRAHPIVAFLQGGPDAHQIVVAIWTGATWDMLPTILVPRVYALALAVDRDDRPWIAASLSHGYGGFLAGETYVFRFDGTSWVGHNGSDTGGGVSNSENGTVGLNVTATETRICVAWSEHDPGYDPDEDGVYQKGEVPRLLVRCSEY